MHDHDGDRTLHNLLTQLGVDLEKRRELNFFFVFDEEGQAANARVALQQKNIDSTVMLNAVPWWKKMFVKSSWSLMATREMALNLNSIMKLTTFFQKVAQRFEGKYDGWEASVEGDNIPGSQL